MSNASPQKGPWLQRLLVRLFTVCFGVLVYWLVGFIIHDIGTRPGPNFDALVKEMRDPQLKAEEERLETQIGQTERDIKAQESRQDILRVSTDNAQTTMRQLLEFQKLSLQKGVKPTEAEQVALGESQQRFLDNQAKFQQLTDQISQLQERLRTLRDDQRVNNERVEKDMEPIHAEYDRLSQRHEFTIAAVKLGVLTPLLIVAFVVFLRKRESTYVPFAVAFGVAVAIQVMLVMHEHFPADFFKYILILTFLAIVTKTLVVLLRAMAFPKRDWLLKQYREAYEAFLCPVCSYPIRRGPLRFMFWTRRSIGKMQMPHGNVSEEEDCPYCCPSCGTSVFEECESCHKIRAALLPTCEHCGATKQVAIPHSSDGASTESPSA